MTALISPLDANAARTDWHMVLGVWRERSEGQKCGVEGHMAPWRRRAAPSSRQHRSKIEGRLAYAAPAGRPKGGRLRAPGEHFGTRMHEQRPYGFNRKIAICGTDRKFGPTRPRAARQNITGILKIRQKCCNFLKKMLNT